MTPFTPHHSEYPTDGSDASLNHASKSEYFLPAPLFVPVRPWTERPFGIVRGSAIVGALESGSHPEAMTVYFEGNIYGDQYFRRFAIRCLHAHGRLAQKYPTVAKAQLLLRDLVQIGIWHPREQIVEVTDMGLLADWCGWTLPVSAEEFNAK